MPEINRTNFLAFNFQTQTRTAFIHIKGIVANEIVYQKYSIKFFEILTRFWENGI